MYYIIYYACELFPLLTSVIFSCYYSVRTVAPEAEPVKTTASEAGCMCANHKPAETAQAAMPEKEVIMTKYREIFRLKSLGLSNTSIAKSAGCARNTVSKTLKAGEALGISWPFEKAVTDQELQKLLFPGDPVLSDKKMPDFDHVHKELQKVGVTKKLLWNEYVEECHQNKDNPLMYSQFCYYVHEDELKRRATMHIEHKPGDKTEVDWAGDHMHIINRFTGEIIDAHLFVAALPYSQYAFVEAFLDEKLPAWITAHVHMYNFFGGVTTILIPDNCKTAVDHNRGFKDQKLNDTYYEMAEYYGTAILPARVRKPKDKPSAEGNVGKITTYIIAALRNEQFFSLEELNLAIRKKLNAYNNESFQKREGSRALLFDEEKAFLRPLPSEGPYKLSTWKKAKVQYNYHVYVDGMYYSVPHNYIKKEVDVRLTDSTVDFIYNQNIIASHARLTGHKNQYSTLKEHMPKSHQYYADWDGDRFRRWAEKDVGPNCRKAVDAILKSREVEQQSYRTCMALIKLAEKHSPELLELACEKGLSYSSSPSYKSIKNILASPELLGVNSADASEAVTAPKPKGITRGAAYYRR